MVLVDGAYLCEGGLYHGGGNAADVQARCVSLHCVELAKHDKEGALHCTDLASFGDPASPDTIQMLKKLDV